MHAMNASSLHLWPGFHGFFKCQHSYNPSLKTVLKAWTCILQLKGKLPAFFSVCFVCGQIWRTWSCSCVIIQTVWSWHSLLTNVFLVELYFTALPGLCSSPGTVFPEPLLGPTAATSLWILLQDLASGHHGTRGNAVRTLMFPHPAPITSLYTWFPHLLL